MLAAKKGSTETAKLLIEKGATIVDKGDVSVHVHSPSCR